MSSIRRKQKMKKFTIDELSSVDRPAQGDAKALIMKRKGKDYEKEEDVKKFDGAVTVVTSADNGHAHVLRIWLGEDRAGTTNFAMAPEGEEHDHPWFFNEEGEIEIAMNDGHMHAVARDAVVSTVMAMVTKGEFTEEQMELVSKRFPEVVPTEESNMDELQKANERLQAIVALPADQRAHFDAIEKAEDQDAFLAKSADERTEIVKAATAPKVEKTETPEAKVEKSEGSEVIYTALNGSTFTKNDDARLVAAVIEADTAKKNADAALAKAEEAAFEKRADEELAHLPGTTKSRAALLKSVEAIEDEGERAQALKALKAGNDAMGNPTNTVGYQGTVAIEKSDADNELDELAKAHANEKGISFEKAYDAVLQTPKGRELYEQHREAMITRH